MTGILVRKALSFKYVPKMAPARSTYNFDAATMLVGPSVHGARDFVVEARPTTAGIKFVVRSIQWCIAATTVIGARLSVIAVSAGKGWLRALMV